MIKTLHYHPILNLDIENVLDIFLNFLASSYAINFRLPQVISMNEEVKEYVF